MILTKCLVYFLVIFLISFTKCEEFSKNIPLSTYELVYSWNSIDYNFSSASERESQLINKEFIPLNNVISGIKVSDHGKIYVSIPRNRAGVPATLATVNYDPSQVTPNNPIKQASTGPLLTPFPDWKAQEIGRCDSFQNVQGIEIDIFNRLWVFDSSFQSDKYSVKCPPKLVIINLKDEKIELNYQFTWQVLNSNNVTNYSDSEIVVGCGNKSILNGSEDLKEKIDVKRECWAYLSYGDKIIVFHLRNEQSWAVSHSSMKIENQKTNATKITILGREYDYRRSIGGLALSPALSNFDTLFFTSFNSLYSISTKILEMGGSNGYNLELSDNDLSLIGKLNSPTGGMTMSSGGLLFYSSLSSNGISYWNSTQNVNFTKSSQLLVSNEIELQWISSFSFDSYGHLYAISNRYQLLNNSNYDPNDINFRILRVFIGTKSYAHSPSDSLTKINKNKTIEAKSGISRNTGNLIILCNLGAFLIGLVLIMH